MCCDNCDVIICYDCMSKLKSKQKRNEDNICPFCKQIYQAKPINYKLLAIINQEMIFSHDCNEEENKELKDV